MNPHLSLLQAYPFERLRQLFSTVTPNPDLRPISLGIGEPRHATPALIKQAYCEAIMGTGLAGYPAELHAQVHQMVEQGRLGALLDRIKRLFKRK